MQLFIAQKLINGIYIGLLAITYPILIILCFYIYFPVQVYTHTPCPTCGRPKIMYTNTILSHYTFNTWKQYYYKASTHTCILYSAVVYSSAVIKALSNTWLNACLLTDNFTKGLCIARHAQMYAHVHVCLCKANNKNVHEWSTQMPATLPGSFWRQVELLCNNGP